MVIFISDGIYLASLHASTAVGAGLLVFRWHSSLTLLWLAGYRIFVTSAKYLQQQPQQLHINNLLPALFVEQ